MRAGLRGPSPSRAWPVAALGAVHPRVPEGLGALLVLDASFVSKSGRGTWGTGWFWSGMARAVRRGLEVALLAAVDVEEAVPIPSVPAVAGRRPRASETCGAATGRETAVETGLTLLREAMAAGAGAVLRPALQQVGTGGTEGSRTQRTRSFQRSMTGSTRDSTSGDSRIIPWWAHSQQTSSSWPPTGQVPHQPHHPPQHGRILRGRQDPVLALAHALQPPAHRAPHVHDAQLPVQSAVFQGLAEGGVVVGDQGVHAAGLQFLE